MLMLYYIKWTSSIVLSFMLSEHNCIKKFKCRQSVKLQYQFLCSLRVNILWQMYCVNNFVEMDAGARKQ